MTTTVTVTGDKNGKGELTDIKATENVQVGHTPFGTARGFYPGLGSDQNKFSVSPTSSGVDVHAEQHASVSPEEEFGMNQMGESVR